METNISDSLPHSPSIPTSVSGGLMYNQSERRRQDREASPAGAQGTHRSWFTCSLFLLGALPITEQNRTFVFLQTSLQLQIVFFHLSFPLRAIFGVHRDLISPAYKPSWEEWRPGICPCWATPRDGRALGVRLACVRGVLLLKY